MLWSLAVCWLAAAPALSQSPDAPRIAYELDEPGQVSAAIYDADGQLVRELRRGEKQDAGAHAIAWDGLDRHGEPSPTGEYEWRVLRTPGFQAEYITSLGINPGTAPWHRWVGNHGGAASVAVDDTGMYIAAQSTETAPVLIKQSRDGAERHWTRQRGQVTKDRGVQGGISLANNQAGTLYLLQQNGMINVIDAERGEMRTRWDVLPADKLRAEDGGPTNWIYSHSETAVADIDMAAHGETIVTSYRERDEVWWIDDETGEAIVKVTVPAPRGVAVTPDGEVLVVSEERVLTVSRSGAQRAIVESGLTAPVRLAFDARSRHVLVAEAAPSHQVKRFTMDGEHVATYGRDGGRRDGTYEPNDFLAMTDLTADGRGGFVVVEERVAPRRVAHFDSDGELVNEWYGGQPYFAWGEPDPREPTKAWFNPGRWLTLAEIDASSGRWRVLENYELDTLGDGLVRGMHGARGRWRVLYHEDERYLVSEGAPQVLRHEPGTLTPVSVVGRKTNANHPTLPRALEIAEADDELKESATAFRWVDDDGNGKPQADELTFTDSRQLPQGSWVADDFSLMRSVNTRDEDGAPLFELRRTVPTWRNGAPVYPFDDEAGLDEPVAATTMPWSMGGRGKGAYRSAAGDYYGHYLARPEHHGSWPTKAGSVARLVKWDADGNEQWKVGRHAVRGGLGGAVPGATPPGNLHVPINVIGEAHGNVILADRVETPAMVWTSDGLYAGWFFDRRVDDGLPDAVYSWWRDAEGREAITTSDNASGGRALQGPDGTVYWFAQGRNSVPVYRVHGWNDWQRESGTITLDKTPPHAQANGEGLRAAYYKGNDLSSEPDAERIDTHVWHGIPRDKDGSHAILSGNYTGPIYDWSDGIEPLDVDTGFAVRWTGEIEAPLTETFTFLVYTRGAVRLWIDGEQRVFAWNQMRNEWETEPMQLRAGERYSVQLEYYTTHEHPLCSLLWESFSLDRQRIPQRYLYPTDIEIIDTAEARPATSRINAGTFDTQSGDITPRRATGRITDRITGLRQRALGKTGAYMGYHRIDFGDGVSRLVADAGGRPSGRGAEFDVTLEFRLDSPDGPTIATLTLNDDIGDGKATSERVVEVTENVTGVRDLYIVNTTTERWHIVRLHSFWFE
ncbi:MAG: FlgD immunoglobulin-like domain containing protein [Phycisphaeraceae bacterium]